MKQLRQFIVFFNLQHYKEPESNNSSLGHIDDIRKSDNEIVTQRSDMKMDDCKDEVSNDARAETEAVADFSSKSNSSLAQSESAESK